MLRRNGLAVASVRCWLAALHALSHPAAIDTFVALLFEVKAS
ncbi:MAG: hypothetical protein ACYDGM_03915 [Vulcanimicrobiaceae bacterium]